MFQIIPWFDQFWPLSHEFPRDAEETPPPGRARRIDAVALPFGMNLLIERSGRVSRARNCPWGRRNGRQEVYRKPALLTLVFTGGFKFQGKISVLVGVYKQSAHKSPAGKLLISEKTKS